MNLMKKAILASCVIQLLLAVIGLTAFQFVSPDRAGMLIPMLAPLTLGFAITPTLKLGGDFNLWIQMTLALVTNFTLYFALFYGWFTFRQRMQKVTVA